MSSEKPGIGNERGTIATEVMSVGKSSDVRTIVVVLMGAVLAFAATIVVVRWFAAERMPVLTVASLEKAEQLWERAGPLGYDMDIELRGAQPGIVQVQVRGGEVAALTRDGRTPQTWTWRYWSVPGMLETLERDLVLAEDPEHEAGAAAGSQWHLRCEFDPQFGYPRRYHRFVTPGGPEVYWRVMRFEPK
jgi:Family of unknown function (DUF6174)